MHNGFTKCALFLISETLGRVRTVFAAVSRQKPLQGSLLALAGLVVLN